MSPQEIPSLAIVGMACRLPGSATNPEKLWAILAEARNCWTNVPETRYNEKAFQNQNPNSVGFHMHRGGHFLNQNVATFDAGFFNVSSAEANVMDPQQRILLETTYEALEDSGITLDHIRASKTAVYMALFSHDYDRIIHEDPNDLPKYHLTGNGEAMAANRISYVFDLKGPSITLDTGCSGSLVALHLACQSLRIGECDMAIVGGVNLILSPDHTIALNDAHMLNDQGRSFPFDTRGSGYGRGEGSTIVVLKRLEDAVKERNHVRAIVRNTGINQDGKTAGIMLPNAHAQAELESSVYADIGIHPHEVEYVEAHGTGTVAGDLAEIEAIARTFCDGRDSPLLVGSIKSNIGHLESASGLAGVIKAVLILEKGLIPPNADFQEAKPDLNLAERHIMIPTKIEKLQGHIASVNSFGYGGTNAHVILERYDQPLQHIYRHLSSGATPKSRVNSPPPDKEVLSPRLFIISAKTEESLRATVRNLKEWISAKHDNSYLKDLAFTLASHRSVFPSRFTFVAADHQEIYSTLVQSRTFCKASSTNQVGFIFSGQGTKWSEMGRELIFLHSLCKESLSKSGAILRDLGATWDLIAEILLGEFENRSRILQMNIVQPAATALQVALVELFRSFGIRPQAVIGHSSGEIAAAYCAGAISHEAALTISYHRGLASSKNGAMLAVGLGEDDVLRYISETDVKKGIIVVACVNSLTNTTLSGNRDAILAVKEVLDSLSIFNRMLNVDVAYHSPQMCMASTPYFQSLDGLHTSEPDESVQFISSITGEAKNSHFGAGYWVESLLSKVRYRDALREYFRIQNNKSRFLKKQPLQILVEVGPDSALAGPTRQIIRESPEFRTCHYYPTLAKSDHAIRSILSLAGRLFEHGVNVNFDKIHTLCPTKASYNVLQGLPTYAWDHSKEYWYESRLSKDYRFRKIPSHDLLGLRLATSSTLEPTWRNFISLDNLPWLKGHVVDDLVVFPGAAYICMAVHAVCELLGSVSRDRHAGFEMKDISFLRAFVIPPPPEIVEVQLSLSIPLGEKIEDRDSWREFRITSLSCDGEWTRNCCGKIKVDLISIEDHDGTGLESHHHIEREVVLNGSQTCSSRTIGSRILYEKLKANGNFYGAHFAAISELEVRDESQAIAHVVVPHIASISPLEDQFNIIHPTTLDALMHSSLPLYSYQNGPGSVMPVSIDHFRLSSDFEHIPGKKVSASVKLASEGLRTAKATISGFNSDQLRTSGPDLKIVAASEIPKISYQMEWGPDPASITLSDVKSWHRIDFDETQRRQLELLNQAAAIYIHRTLDQLAVSSLDSIRKHHRIFLSWMENQRSSSWSRKGIESMAESSPKTVLKEILGQVIECDMLLRVGEKLPQILSGDIDPLLTMLDGDLLHKYYKSDSSAQCYPLLHKYVENLIFHNPCMSILEIGAGTAAATLSVFENISAKNRVQLERYDVTDISAGFFERARDLLAEWREFINYSTLDIEVDPIDQGYTKHSYDLVIAANALHATRSIDQTLSNVRALLKPGGTLLLIEATRQQTYLNVIFGTLPGWWRGVDEGRRDGPLLTKDDWLRALSRNGFHNVQIAGKDTDGPGQVANIMVSKACDIDRTNLPYPVNFIAEDDDISNKIPSRTDILLQAFEETGIHCSLKSWQSDLTRKDVVYVVLDSGKKPFLVDPTASRFGKIVELATEASNVFWISVSEDATALMNPEKSLITGLARTAHAENENLSFVTFDAQQSLEDHPEKLIQMIVQVFLRSFCTSPTNTLREREYVYRNHQLLIPRLIPSPTLDEWISQASGKLITEMRMYGQPGQPLKVIIERHCSVGGITFEHDNHSNQHLEPFHIEIDVKAFGIDSRGAMILLRQAKSWPIMGECAGVITGLGSSLTKFSIGDRVCAIGGTPYGNRNRIHGENVFEIPHDMSFTTAAAVPLAFLSAHYTLYRTANLRRGQTILIHPATGDIGQAAILFAQSIGAVVLVTVARRADRDLLVERFGIPSECILFEKWRSLKERLLEFTNGKGVDVLMHCSREKTQIESWSCLASYGTLIQIRTPPVSPKVQYNVALLGDNVTSFSFDPVSFVRDRPREAMKSLTDVMRMIKSGHVRPRLQITVFPVAGIDDAFKNVLNQKSIGKTVVDTASNSMVRTVRPTHPTISLDENATYIIAGGLGDFGRRIIRLMVIRGARNIFVLSRRSLGPEEKQKIEAELQSIAANSRFHSEECNIADISQVRRAASTIFRIGFPAAKGLVQAAAVLRDVPLWRMKLEDFVVPLETKLHGTRHLQEVFQSQPLDFFLNLSSTSSIVGSRSCANYGAGNCFQDALAQNHAPSKTRYVSANIGGIVEGAAVNNEAQERNLWEQGLLTITPEQLLAFLEFSMSSDCCKQPIIGLNHFSLSRARLPNATPRTAMFNHVWYFAKKREVGKDRLVKESLKESISKEKKPEEIHQIISTVMAGKVLDLVSVDRSDIDFNSSMAELGLDSLITIELKNWIAKELAVAIQPSEILEHKSIHALAATLMSRLGRFAPMQELHRMGKTEGGRPNTTAEDPALSPRHSPRSHEQEPYLPLPELEESLQMYLASRLCFLSPEEFAHMEHVIQEFQREGGLGRKLQERLVARTKDPKIDNWQSGPYAQNIYLARRDPIHPYMTFYGGLPLTKIGHDQADRAAIISSAAFAFMQHIESGTLDQNSLNAEPVCMDTLQWLFNACRKPAIGVDEMQKSTGNQYVVVLRRGHIFEIQLNENGQTISQSRLRLVYQSILDCTSEVPALATLTAGERDLWAEVRNQVISISSTNAKAIAIIEAAAFVVCLDDGSPSTPSERCNQFFLGDPSNRWSDKTLQFVVCENGASAFVGEHAALDGLSVTQLSRFMSEAILAYENGAQDVGASDLELERNPISASDQRSKLGDGLARELTFVIAPTHHKHICRIREEFRKAHAPIEFTHLNVPTLGHSFLRKHKCPSRTGYQLVIQLACLLYYGYNPPSWETISMARFHKGRVDWIQTVQPAVAAFCSSAARDSDGRVPLAEQRGLLFKAATAHANAMTRIARGRGFKAHLHSLLEMVGAGEDTPELFKDRSWEETRVQSTKIVKTDCLEGLMVQEMAFLMPRPECIFLHYDIEDDRCLFFVQAWPGKTGQICDALTEAATRVRKILESG